MSTRKCLVSVAATVGAILVMPGVASAATTVSETGNVITVQAGVGTGGYGQKLTISSVGTTVTLDGSDLTGALSGNCSGSAPIQCTGTSVVVNLDGVAGAPDANTIDAKALTWPLVVNGSVGGDRVEGGSNGDTLNGNAGEDTLSGLGGDDELNGGADADHLVGGRGIDDADGGLGNDFVGMEADGSSGDDQDNIDCGGDSGDIVGVDMSFTGGPPLEQSPIVGCERQLPHFRGASSLASTPVSGRAYSGANVAPAQVFGSAPDASSYEWYLCSGPVLTGGAFEGTIFRPGGANPACRLAGSGATFAVPANASGQYLGVLGWQGLATTAGDVGGVTWSTEGYVGTTARLIAAAPGAPPSAISSFTTPSKKTCKSSKCSLTLTKTAAGKVTIEGSSKSFRKLISKSTSNVKAGKVNVAVKLKSAAKKKLKRKKKLTVSVKVTFQPANAVPLSKKVKITYKLK